MNQIREWFDVQKDIKKASQKELNHFRKAFIKGLKELSLVETELKRRGCVCKSLEWTGGCDCGFDLRSSCLCGVFDWNGTDKCECD